MFWLYFWNIYVNICNKQCIIYIQVLSPVPHSHALSIGSLSIKVRTWFVWFVFFNYGHTILSGILQYPCLSMMTDQTDQDFCSTLKFWIHVRNGVCNWHQHLAKVCFFQVYLSYMCGRVRNTLFWKSFFPPTLIMLVEQWIIIKIYFNMLMCSYMAIFPNGIQFMHHFSIPYNKNTQWYIELFIFSIFFLHLVITFIFKKA